MRSTPKSPEEQIWQYLAYQQLVKKRDHDRRVILKSRERRRAADDAEFIENEKMLEGFTPLHYAAQDGDEARVRDILNNEFDPNTPCWRTGQTPLFIAAKFGHARVVKLLLAHGARDDIEDNLATTPLAIAIANKRADVVKILAAGKKTRSEEAQVSLHDMLTLLKNNKHHELEEIFIRNQCTKDIFGVTTALYDAVEIGSEEMVLMLLRHGVPINKKGSNAPGNTPLQLACSKKLLDIAAILLSHGAKVDIKNSKNETAFDIAFKQDKMAALYLFDRDEWQQVNNVLDLVKAVQFGTVDEVSKYLKVCRNFKKLPGSYGGNSLLHFAASRGDVSICQLLIDSGLPVDEINSSSISPMALALLAGHDEVFMFLHENGARLSYIPNQTATLLQDKHVPVLIKHKALAILLAEWVQYPEDLHHLNILTTLFSNVDLRLVAKLIFAFQYRNTPLPADAMKHLQSWCKQKINDDDRRIIKTYLLNIINDMTDLNERLKVCEITLCKPEDNLLSFAVNVKKHIADPRKCDTVIKIKILADQTRQQLQEQRSVVAVVLPEVGAALTDCRDVMNDASFDEGVVNNNEFPALSALMRHSHFAPATDQAKPLYPQLPPPAYSTLLPAGYALSPPPSYQSLLAENEVVVGEDGNLRFVARSGK